MSSLVTVPDCSEERGGRTKKSEAIAGSQPRRRGLGAESHQEEEWAHLGLISGAQRLGRERPIAPSAPAAGLMKPQVAPAQAGRGGFLCRSFGGNVHDVETLSRHV